MKGTKVPSGQSTSVPTQFLQPPDPPITRCDYGTSKPGSVSRFGSFPRPWSESSLVRTEVDCSRWLKSEWIPGHHCCLWCQIRGWRGQWPERTDRRARFENHLRREQSYRCGVELLGEIHHRWHEDGSVSSMMLRSVKQFVHIYRLVFLLTSIAIDRWTAWKRASTWVRSSRLTTFNFLPTGHTSSQPRKTKLQSNFIKLNPVKWRIAKTEIQKILSSRNLAVLKSYPADTPLNTAAITPKKDYVILGGGQAAMDVTTTSARQGKFEARFYHKIFEDELAVWKDILVPLIPLPCILLVLPTLQAEKTVTFGYTISINRTLISCTRLSGSRCDDERSGRSGRHIIKDARNKWCLSSRMCYEIRAWW